MSKQSYPAEFIKLLKSVKAKRPKTVIEHILKYGQITSEELKAVYGYNHPPRAVRDVREQGIPIRTFRVTGSDNRKIAAYEFGDPTAVRTTQLSGRTRFSTKLKSMLIDKYGATCHIYLQPFPIRELQIDHRVPFEIAGDAELSEDTSAYRLLCASANRAKAWSCEHCPNWTEQQKDICLSCYWAYPESYDHIATREIRRLDLIWSENEIDDYEQLKQTAEKRKETIPDYVKNVLRNHLKHKTTD